VPQGPDRLVMRYDEAILTLARRKAGAKPRTSFQCTSMAGFGGHGPTGPRTAIPAALRYALAVSRLTPVASSIRRRLHPSRPRACTCCCFSVLKTLPIPDGRTTVHPPSSTSRPATPFGRFSGDHLWPVLGDHRGDPSATSVSERRLTWQVTRASCWPSRYEISPCGGTAGTSLAPGQTDRLPAAAPELHPASRDS
jgi:hypothetical protein